jgi:hypothetical protein
MNDKKEIDCIRLKDEIQAQLRKNWEGLSDAEIRERINRDLDTSEEPIAVWWRRIRERSQQH